jgi:hypothetical protein
MSTGTVSWGSLGTQVISNVLESSTWERAMSRGMLCGWRAGGVQGRAGVQLVPLAHTSPPAGMLCGGRRAGAGGGAGGGPTLCMARTTVPFL